MRGLAMRAVVLALVVLVALLAGGAEPTSWTIISSVAITATDPMPQRLFMSAHDSAATPAQTITWDLVRLQAVQ